MSPQRLNPEEVFEDHYTDAFKSRFRGRGIGVAYDRDRAARDVGIHLTAPGSLELSDVRVWFQLKGIHRERYDAATLRSMASVPIVLSADDVKKWYAAPEAVYIVVYLEALDEFIGEDIRDLVDRRFSDHKGSFASKMTGLEQQKLALRVSTSAVVDEDRIAGMLRHRAMRIDGPAWRGRPLGHRFDPLRSELAVIEPNVFVDLVEALLTAHDFRIDARLDAGKLLAGVRDGTDYAYLCVGTMYSTYEWSFPLGVEYGFSPDTDFREEGQTFTVQGPVAILVHSKFSGHARRADEASNLLASLSNRGIETVLVIANAPDTLLLASYRSVLGSHFVMPQGQGSLAFSVLVTPLVFMAFQDRLRWNFVNYLWENPGRPPVRIRT
jgi:hypothetical protein